jgi:hypothetical protein
MLAVTAARAPGHLTGASSSRPLDGHPFHKPHGAVHVLAVAGGVSRKSARPSPTRNVTHQSITVL